jgi:hypothetical protein
MYTLELDLVFRYIPPMNEIGGGVHLTREFQIPFPPYNGLQICSQSMDLAPGLLGFVLKEVKWDVDRSRFLAHTELCCHDVPMEEIPADLRSWVDLGWHLGSYTDQYEVQEEELDTNGSPEKSLACALADEEAILRQVTFSPRKRSKELNKIMAALVRTMAESNNNLSVAYGMDKTKRFFTTDQIKDDDSMAAHQWVEAKREFEKMDWEGQEDWRDRVIRTHPRLDRIIDQCRR